MIGESFTKTSIKKIEGKSNMTIEQMLGNLHKMAEKTPLPSKPLKK